MIDYMVPHPCSQSSRFAAEPAFEKQSGRQLKLIKIIAD